MESHSPTVPVRVSLQMLQVFWVPNEVVRGAKVLPQRVQRESEQHLRFGASGLALEGSGRRELVLDRTEQMEPRKRMALFGRVSRPVQKLGAECGTRWAAQTMCDCQRETQLAESQMLADEPVPLPDGLQRIRFVTIQIHSNSLLMHSYFQSSTVSIESIICMHCKSFLREQSVLYIYRSLCYFQLQYHFLAFQKLHFSSAKSLNFCCAFQVVLMI